MPDFPDSATNPPNPRDISRGFVAELVTPSVANKIGTAVSNAVLDSAKLVLGFLVGIYATLVAHVADVMLSVMSVQDAKFERVANVALDSIIDSGQPAVGPGTEQTNEAARRILANLTNNGEAPVPSIAPAERWLGEVVRMSVQSWFQGFIIEAASDAIPLLDGIETYGALEDKLEAAMGLGRLSNKVLHPYVQRTVVEPLEWALNQQWRSEQLTMSQATRALLGGWIEDAEFTDIYSRRGFSDRYARAILAESTKRHSAEDYDLLIRAGVASREAGVQAMREAGYDYSGSQIEIDIPRLKRIAAFERSMATEAVTAYAAGRITEGELSQFLTGATIDAQESAQLRELAAARRLLRRKALSPDEARRAAKAEIVSVREYERALRGDGYDEDAIDTLTILLRKEMDDRATAEDLRRRRAAEREDERLAREALTEARRAEVERVRALRRRGSESDLERAAIRGIIPIGRYVEILRDDFDLDTVGVMTALVEEQRQAYLDQQARAEDAERTARRRGLNVGTLRAAVFVGALSLPEFRAELARLGLDAGAADLLTETLAAQVADRTAAAQRRLEAEEAARVKSINLSQFERLVRRGVRTVAEYDALVQTLGFDPASRAALVDLLEIQIADDAAHRRAADEAERLARARGLSLADWRRAVVRGVRSRDAYQTMLVQQGFTTDATAALLALVDADVADAEDARRRRADADASPDARRLPLSAVADAARLGLVSPTTYQARLAAAGYSDDDVAIAIALLVTEIADVQAARARRQHLEAAQADRGLSLAQLARAVRLGVASMDTYRARATELGFVAEDVAILVTVLTEELAQAAAARARLDSLATAPDALGAVVAAIVEQTRSGALAIGAAVQQLAAAGVSPEDVELARAVLVEEQAG